MKRRTTLAAAWAGPMAAAVWAAVVCAAAFGLGAPAPVLAAEVEVSGDIQHPLDQFPPGSDYKLAGDTQFGWVRQPITGNLDINGHKFTMETGGGNTTVFSGSISGVGQFVWNGGGMGGWQTTASFLKGERANTFSGTLTILRGTLALAKPPGVDAVAGDIVLGGGGNQAILRLDAPNQIKDSANLLITGKCEGRIWTQGFDETLGSLDLQAHGYIDLGGRGGTLRLADSSGRKWDPAKTLTIQNWKEGKDKVFFGTDGHGLTGRQVERIGFADPAGRPKGLYAAKLLDDGQVVPDRKVEPVNPPFDLSPAAQAERKKLYDIPGRANLTGPSTPLKAGTRISFFGDSITWLDGYVGAIRAAIGKSPATKDLGVQLFNHGINGGGVLSVRDGSEKAAYIDPAHKDGKQAPFADVIAADKADVAVVFIGVNDVWWRNTKPADFEKALRDLAASAKTHHTRLVLATLSVYREKPDGTNPKDAACDQYAEITRRVAASTGATLVDPRTAFIAYLRNHNVEMRVDGSLTSVETGILTYDGVHPSATGVDLLADLIAQGICDALGRN